MEKQELLNDIQKLGEVFRLEPQRLDVLLTELKYIDNLDDKDELYQHYRPHERCLDGHQTLEVRITNKILSLLIYSKNN